MNLHDEIISRGDCAADLSARDIDRLAAILSAGRTSIQSRFVTARTILAEVSGGAALLDKMQNLGSTLPAVRYAMTFLNQESGIDIGHAATQGMVDQLVGGGALTASEGAALKNLAVQPAIVTRSQVADAMFNPDGTQK